LAFGGWLSAISFWRLAFRFWRLASGFWLLAIKIIGELCGDGKEF